MFFLSFCFRLKSNHILECVCLSVSPVSSPLCECVTSSFDVCLNIYDRFYVSYLMFFFLNFLMSRMNVRCDITD